MQLKLQFVKYYLRLRGKAVYRLFYVRMTGNLCIKRHVLRDEKCSLNYVKTIMNSCKYSQDPRVTEVGAFMIFTGRAWSTCGLFRLLALTVPLGGWDQLAYDLCSSAFVSGMIERKENEGQCQESRT